MINQCSYLNLHLHLAPEEFLHLLLLHHHCPQLHIQVPFLPLPLLPLLVIDFVAITISSTFEQIPCMFGYHFLQRYTPLHQTQPLTLLPFLAHFVTLLIDFKQSTN
jgi:hypothetical protein